MCTIYISFKTFLTFSSGNILKTILYVKKWYVDKGLYPQYPPHSSMTHHQYCLYIKKSSLLCYLERLLLLFCTLRAPVRGALSTAQGDFFEYPPPPKKGDPFFCGLNCQSFNKNKPNYLYFKSLKFCPTHFHGRNFRNSI